MPPNGSRISLLPGMWIEKNLDFKLRHPLFTADIGPLLAPGYSMISPAIVVAYRENGIRHITGRVCAENIQRSSQI
jgi:hypothetical protein